ncbi:MAG TPA: class I SAM-dependent methyltransferase [Candidatus Saccharimonadales bacterium]|nr:class I SAM-dependent methyltransferase [Candidatus Saccharimonadales bacterium]
MSAGDEHHVCPWWLGYFLSSPIRKLWHNPTTILSGRVGEGQRVLEPGPGMGFFTLELARMVGPKGRVVAVDLQPKMLNRLKRRAMQAGLGDRIETRVATSESLAIEDLAGSFDFILAFAMVHELRNPGKYFREVAAAGKTGATPAARGTAWSREGFDV